VIGDRLGIRAAFVASGALFLCTAALTHFILRRPAGPVGQIEHSADVASAAEGLQPQGA
jgi:hypothetical protein